MPRARRLRQIVRLSSQEWADLWLAAYELLRANIVLASRSPLQVAQQGLADTPGNASPTPDQAQLIDRVAWAIPRAARVVPWRSDCLRQAEAARHWLLRSGVIAEMRLGARKDAGDNFEAHAWLIFGEMVITGGDVSGYSSFGNTATPVP